MSEPIRITKNASAGELAECLGQLGEEIEKRATDQTRADVADALRDTFVDRTYTPITYTSTPAEAIIEAIRVSPKTKLLRDLAARFDEEGVSADFRAGLVFAIAMIKDPEFEL